MKHTILYTFLMIILLSTLVLYFVTAEENKQQFETIEIRNSYITELISEKTSLNEKYLSVSEELKAKMEELNTVKSNAARIVSLDPIRDLITETEMEQLLQEIPTGNPFSVNFIVTAPYGKSMGFNGAYRQDHKGIDIAPIDGHWEIYPYAPGVVEQFGYDQVYGKFLYVRHSENVRSFYAHADKIFYRATTGQKVENDTVMMIMGETGQADGPHLHFQLEVQTSRGWIAVDPKPFLKD